MKIIKEMIPAAVAGAVFIAAVTAVLYARDHREKLESGIYRRNRYERLFQIHHIPGDIYGGVLRPGTDGNTEAVV